MGLGHYLFGFSGRINRAKQWAIILVSLVQNLLLATAFSFTVGFTTLVAVVQKTTTPAAVIASPQAHLFGTVFCVLFVLGFYIGLAVTTKRLHDRNKSAWWLLVFFVLPLALNLPAFLQLPETIRFVAAALKAAQQHVPPPPPPVQSPLVTLTRGAASLLSIWAFVELYILRGTVGDNRYGPDPLAPRA